MVYDFGVNQTTLSGGKVLRCKNEVRTSKHNLLCSNEHKNLPYGQIAKASGSASSYVCLSVTKLQTAVNP